MLVANSKISIEIELKISLLDGSVIACEVGHARLHLGGHLRQGVISKSVCRFVACPCEVADRVVLVGLPVC